MKRRLIILERVSVKQRLLNVYAHWPFFRYPLLRLPLQRMRTPERCIFCIRPFVSSNKWEREHAAPRKCCVPDSANYHMERVTLGLNKTFTHLGDCYDSCAVSKTFPTDLDPALQEIFSKAPALQEPVQLSIRRGEWRGVPWGGTYLYGLYMGVTPPPGGGGGGGEYTAHQRFRRRHRP